MENDSKTCDFCNPDFFVVYGRCKKCGTQSRAALMQVDVPIGFVTERGSSMLKQLMKSQRDYNSKNQE
jgi:hypothetical protein